MGGTATGLSQIAGLLGITVLNVHNINHDPYIGDAEPWPGYKPRAPEWMIRPDLPDETNDQQHLYGDYRSEEHTSDLQSQMRTSYAVFCVKNTQNNQLHNNTTTIHNRSN